MDEAREKPALLKELHRDLIRKYQLHGTRIEHIWRSLSRNQRKEAVQAGAIDGRVLKNRTDQAMGNVYDKRAGQSTAISQLPSLNIFLSTNNNGIDLQRKSIDFGFPSYLKRPNLSIRAAARIY